MSEQALSVPARVLSLAAPLRAIVPGAALAGVIALAATFVSVLHGGPQLLYALFLGISFHYLSHEPRTRPGIEFCSRTVLRLGVGLLGARITTMQIAGLGWSTALIVVAAVASTILVGHALGRRLGLEAHGRELGIVIAGVGNPVLTRIFPGNNIAFTFQPLLETGRDGRIILNNQNTCLLWIHRSKVITGS